MKSWLTLLYRFLTNSERLFFKTFSFLVHRSNAKVVTIGNLSMGGTGKTPVLFELLNELAHLKPCVLTRGYRSPWERSFYLLHGDRQAPPQMTDEALMLNERFPMIPVLVGKNRHHSAIMAEIMFSPSLILLDDGFQYRRLKKDVNLVLWDSMSSEKEAALIPAGRLREPLWRLREADAILLTRCELASRERIDFWQTWLQRHSENKPIILMQTECEGIFAPSGERLDNVAAKRKWLTFSAIGRPESFYGQLKLTGAQVAEKVEFRDHHRFSDVELDKIAAIAKGKGLSIICTEKDACKISAERRRNDDIHVLRIRMRPVSKISLVDELNKFSISLLPQ